MNLAKLFEVQRQLDVHIEKEHPRQKGEDRLAKKILALQVELGELANEWRGYKFWSYDQEPRYKLYDEDEFALLGDMFEQEYPLLEEYVDGLRFILSIGLDITDPELIELREIDKAKTITEQFIMVFDAVRELYEFEYEHRDYESLLIRFIDLGKMLGFTWEEVEQAYLEKNKINHHRQEARY